MQGFDFHAWLAYVSKIIDLSTHQLRQKVEELNALDGGHTEFDWFQIYLWRALQR
jgi:hypothetical protein